MRVFTLWILVLFAFSSLPDPSQAQDPPGTDIYLSSISTDNGRMRLGPPLNITDRDGYDNQPLFDPDGGAIYYTSIRQGQADTYRYDVVGQATVQVINTPESEYSPTVMPDGRSISVVRVEADSTQRLWEFSLQGFTSSVILADVKPVGYHAWGDDRTVALFVLGSPPTLQFADTRTGHAEVIARGVGRSLHKIPGRAAISFVQMDSSTGAWIYDVSLATRQRRALIKLLEGNEFYAWTPHGAILMGRESKIYRWRPGTDASWQEIADFTSHGVAGISRLAVSPDGKYLAIVGSRR